jgi:hypothetical protein
MAALGTRKLTLLIDSLEVAPAVSKAVITSEETDSDFVSFTDAASGGGRSYKLAITAVQDAASTSLWYKVWNAAGTDVPFTLRPYGNTTPTATEPHFTGTCTIKEPDGDFIGGEADASVTAKFTVEVEFPLTAKPTRVTA